MFMGLEKKYYTTSCVDRIMYKIYNIRDVCAKTYFINNLEEIVRINYSFLAVPKWECW